MNQKRKEKMTTIKVTPEVGAIVSVAVKMMKTKGDKDMTASTLLYRAMEKLYPEAVIFIEGGKKDKQTEDEDTGNEE